MAFGPNPTEGFNLGGGGSDSLAGGAFGAAGLAGLGLSISGMLGAKSAGSDYSAATAPIAAAYTAAGATYSQAGQAYSQATTAYANTANPLYAQSSQQDVRIASAEQEIQNINREYMESTNTRSQLQNIRDLQQANAQATAGAAATGALYGSGVRQQRGAQAAASATNAEALSQGRQSGESTFAENSAISNARIQQFGISTALNQAKTTYDYAQNVYQLAGSQYQVAGSQYQAANQTATQQYQVASSTAQGQSQLGGSLLSAAGTIAKVFLL